jgi:hypothetical protein
MIASKDIKFQSFLSFLTAIFILLTGFASVLEDDMTLAVIIYCFASGGFFTISYQHYRIYKVFKQRESEVALEQSYKPSEVDIKAFRKEVERIKTLVKELSNESKDNAETKKSPDNPP